VSYAQTGERFAPNYVFTANGVVISFFELLTIPDTPTFASLTYRADDSAALYINNALVQPEAPQQGNTYSVCSDFAVGCTELTELTLDIAPYLAKGDNTLRFDVAQRGGSSFGLNYAGTVNYVEGDAADTPEPATYGLIGLGLIGLGMCKRPASSQTRRSRR
jgi:hypothetical protein